jgi:hypothetical protein
MLAWSSLTDRIHARRVSTGAAGARYTVQFDGFFASLHDLTADGQYITPEDVIVYVSSRYS